MVKYVCISLLMLAFAAPAFAQDYAPFELSLGYGNLGVNDLEGRHSGFTTHQTFNLNSWLAIENFIGYYGFGTDPFYGKTTLFTDIFGGRFNYRKEGLPVFYGIAGIGGGFLRYEAGYGSNNSLAFRFGGGADIPLNDS